MTVIAVELPDETIQHLKQVANAQQQSIEEVVRTLVMQELPIAPALPAEEEAELAAFAHLSDEVLWLIARSTLTPAEQAELAILNDQAQRAPLSPTQIEQRDRLLEQYDRVIVRRARAAEVLQGRGYDISNPAVLQ